MIKRITLYIIAMFTVVSAAAQPVDVSAPRLVVNVVVSGMRAIDIERYQNNLGLGGFRLLWEEGLRYDNCQYSYQQTTTPVSLSTIATGALPSTHGVVGHLWYDYVTGEKIDLIVDPKVENVEYTPNEGGYSPANLLVPTLSEALILDSPHSQAVSVALDPTSAILLSGKAGAPFWFDGDTCNWASSTSYMDSLPQWAVDHNHAETDISLTKSKWTMSQHSDLYFNSRYNDQKGGYILGNAANIKGSDDRRVRLEKYYKQICSSPIGNQIVASFAKLAVASMNLGADESVDILNICFDASRNIIESYGPESVEVEDMYYKLDETLTDLFKFISSQVKDHRVVFVLTSDHGSSPSVAVDANRFNSRQFEVILNGFLSVRYGNDNWVLGCANGAVYLNRNTIYKHSLALTDVQSEVAAFALQLEGVSHAASSVALSSSYFGMGYAHMIQNGFFARRSGDVVLNLMPHWIERDDDRLSQSGSMYNYDRAVPLIIYSKNGIASEVIHRRVDMISLSPTLAAIMGIREPAAAEGGVLEEFAK